MLYSTLETLGELEAYSKDIPTLRKQIRYRCWNRGTRESDILLGSFADGHIDSLSDGDVLDFAALLSNSDADIYDWLSGHTPVPKEYDTAVFRMLSTLSFPLLHK